MSAKLILLLHESEDDSIEEIISVCLNYMAGWNVVSIPFTYEGINRLLSKQPDAILLDVLLCEMPGLSIRQRRLIKKLKSYPLTQASPILLVTDKASWFTPEQLQALGITGAIEKPFDPVTLPAQIAKILHWSE
ncbi:response regulator [Nodosilinea sp. E11]|uniref:response regulator n=1 Tax=Nodosilinea sp. E11 TaxID=3037479 RepID=UPI0029351FE7|nr:response regulator [Nodosilinea sp. E11]WOD37032.1 response regulator [Nodosilinea sp. E11]